MKDKKITYADLRPGDILLWKAYPRWRWLFHWITGSEYGHAAIFVGHLLGQPLIVAAGWNGVIIQVLRGEPNVWRVRDANWALQAAEKALGRVGRSYDFLQLLGFLISKITGSRYNPFDSREKYICSELVNACYDYKLGPRGLTAPGTLAQSPLVDYVGKIIKGRPNED